MTLTMLLGGARSGKSALAVELGHRYAAGGGHVAYIATAPRVDDDMALRIERHRDERPKDWHTIEEQTDLESALDRVGDAMAIIDCLTLWTSNLLLAGIDDDDVIASAREAAGRTAVRAAPTVVISNEVGLGVHPDTELGRRYRDVLGRVNQTWAAAATTSLFLVAGRAMPLSDPLSMLEPQR
ncbi:MAG: bifunctional adenosylcobinamide kinase/adenosylcobinamide-phosphate guanylyltransferase [Acidimicrobiia bacterium]|nr:bifunctional adenosylcobinamide kinase/adenosylcobinamide-phosphate guanylyltransferase [Acidimicrobiia bacterium]